MNADQTIDRLIQKQTDFYNGLADYRKSGIDNNWVKCRRCQRWERPMNALFLEYEVPFGERGHYHIKCAREVIQEYQRICRACEEQYVERYTGGNSHLCPNCQKDKVIRHEESRVHHEIIRSVKLNLPCTLTMKDWFITLAYFGWSCAYCGGPFDVLEHFIPVIAGGGTTANNCVPSCNDCNHDKKDKSAFRVFPEQAQRIAEYLASRG